MRCEGHEDPLTKRIKRLHLHAACFGDELFLQRLAETVSRGGTLLVKPNGKPEFSGEIEESDEE